MKSESFSPSKDDDEISSLNYWRLPLPDVIDMKLVHQLHQSYSSDDLTFWRLPIPDIDDDELLELELKAASKTLTNDNARKKLFFNAPSGLRHLARPETEAEANLLFTAYDTTYVGSIPINVKPEPLKQATNTRKTWCIKRKMLITTPEISHPKTSNSSVNGASRRQYYLENADQENGNISKKVSDRFGKTDNIKQSQPAVDKPEPISKMSEISTDTQSHYSSYSKATMTNAKAWANVKTVGDYSTSNRASKSETGSQQSNGFSTSEKWQRNEFFGSEGSVSIAAESEDGSVSNAVRPIATVQTSSTRNKQSRSTRTVSGGAPPKRNHNSKTELSLKLAEERRKREEFVAKRELAEAEEEAFAKKEAFNRAQQAEGQWKEI